MKRLRLRAVRCALCLCERVIAAAAAVVAAAAAAAAVVVLLWLRERGKKRISLRLARREMQSERCFDWL